jgi:uncharacterized cupin superfamily protein
MRVTLLQQALLLCALALQAPARADETPKPILLERAALDGAAFEDPRTVAKEERSERGAFRTRDLEAFISADRRLDAGVYEAGPNRYTISEPYGVDEFMYFLEGGVTLTSADGSVMQVRAGDAVLIPRDWKGMWDTDGYRKIYVIYSPDKPIE